MLGHYTLLRKIGGGGMAEVWTAQPAQGEDRTTVAVKKVLPPFCEDREFRETFGAELEQVRRLDDANVVRILETGLEPAACYLVMEYIAGTDLAALLTQLRQGGGKVPPELVIHIGLEVAKGLAAAHRESIVHHHLSPQNILLSSTGEVKVSNFGFARTASVPSVTRSGVRRGKIAYMSPEQAGGEPTDASSDVFSLGLVLYEMAAGRPFLQGTPEQIAARLESRADPTDAELAAVPALLREVIFHSLRINRIRRIRSAADLEAELTAIQSGSSIPPRKALRQLLRESFPPPPEAPAPAPEPAAVVEEEPPAIEPTPVRERPREEPPPLRAEPGTRTVMEVHQHRGVATGFFHESTQAGTHAGVDMKSIKADVAEARAALATGRRRKILFLAAGGVVLVGAGYQAFRSLTRVVATALAVPVPTARLTGTLHVDSLQDAEVFVDGQRWDRVPTEVNRLRVPSTIVLEVKKDGFEPWSREIDVVGDKGGNFEPVLLKHQPAGKLTLQIPGGVTARVDGRRLGGAANAVGLESDATLGGAGFEAAPGPLEATVELQPGAHQIRLHAPDGSLLKEAEVTIKAGKKLSFAP